MEFIRVTPPGADVAVVRRPQAAATRPAGTLLFLHGLGDSASAFSPAFETQDLAPFDVLLVDLLGHGQSDKPDDFDYSPASHGAVLFQALRKVRFQTPLHIVGYSFGGAVAVELARFPLQGLASIILVEPALEADRVEFAARITQHSEAEFLPMYPELLASYATSDSSEADRRWAETAAFASARAIYRCAKGLIQASNRGELVAHFKQLALKKSVILSHETYGQWPLIRSLEKGGVKVFLVEAPHKMPFYESPDGFYSAVAQAARSATPQP